MSEEKTAAADLSNRREIPVSSFDLLAGGYTRRMRSRMAALVVTGALIVVAGYLGLRGYESDALAEEYTLRAEARAAEAEGVYDQLGGAANVDLGGRELIGRYEQMVAAFDPVVASALDLPGLVSGIVGVGTAGAWPGRIAITIPEEGGTLGRPQVTVNVTGGDVAAIVAGAEAVRAVPGLEITSEQRNGVSSIDLTGIERTDVAAATAARLRGAGLTPDRAEVLATTDPEQTPEEQP